MLFCIKNKCFELQIIIIIIHNDAVLCYGGLGVIKL